MCLLLVAGACYTLCIWGIEDDLVKKVEVVVKFYKILHDHKMHYNCSTKSISNITVSSLRFKLVPLGHVKDE